MISLQISLFFGTSPTPPASPLDPHPYPTVNQFFLYTSNTLICSNCTLITWGPLYRSPTLTPPHPTFNNHPRSKNWNKKRTTTTMIFLPKLLKAISSYIFAIHAYKHRYTYYIIYVCRTARINIGGRKGVRPNRPAALPAAAAAASDDQCRPAPGYFGGKQGPFARVRPPPLQLQKFPVLSLANRASAAGDRRNPAAAIYIAGELVFPRHG